jgi:transglutaminase-like putative cysteine protease
MKKINNVLILSTLAFLFCRLEADTSTLIDKEEALKKAKEATREKFPDSDVVVIDDYEKIAYKPDGTNLSLGEVYQKILTEKGKRESKTHTFGFMLPYSTVKIPFLEVIKPDGTSIAVDVKKNSRIMVDRSQMGSNIYNPNNKELKLTVPNLEIGDTLHYTYERDTVKTRVPDTWSGFSVFEYTSPIMSAELEIDAPKELPLKNILLRDEIKGKVTHSKTEKNGRIIYKWQVKDVPRIFKEPSMPPYWTVVQRLLSSTIPDWQYLSKWYWNLCKPRLEKTTPEMEAKVKELTKGITDKKKKIEAIYRFVSQKIRYMGLTTEKTAPGYEPHDVKITFENKYGVCRDKAALLAAMLRLAGFKAYPTLINSGPKKDPKVPQPYFNHAITAVENEDGSYTLMDSTDESSRDIFPAYLCDKSYLVAKPEGETLKTSPIVPASDNLLVIKTEGSVFEDGTISAKTSLEFQGVNDGIYRGAFSRWKTERRKDFFEGRLKRIISGASLEKLKIEPEDLRDTSKPLKVTLEYKAPNFLITGQSDTLAKPPWFGTSFGVVNFILGKTGLEKRKYPLVTDIACGAQESFELKLDKTVGKALAMPDYEKINSDTLLWKRSLNFDAGKLNGKSEFLIKVVEFSPEQYLGLKKSLKDIEYQSRKLPIFAKGTVNKESKKLKSSEQEKNKSEYTEKDCDIVLLDDETEIEILDKNSCVVKKKIKKKILTYAGKKKNSEIKINYNPVWEDVKITAKVTGKDGKTKELGKDELNLMDASWAGSAPRYPAGKTLVASLPGVDTGSIIEYSIEIKRKKVPFLSFIKYFKGTDPIEKRTVKLIAPEGMKLKIIEPEKGCESSKKKENGKEVYSWTVKKQAAVKVEDSMPPWWTFNPTLFISNGDWKEYSRKLNDKLIEAASNNPKTAKKATELLKESKTETIKAIRDFVAKSVRHAGPGLNSLPLECISKADTTLEDGYGNTTDLAVLLYALLKAAGLEPEFILVSGYPDLPEILSKPNSAPQRFIFNRLLVKIDNIYLNDTSQYAKLGSSNFADSPALFLNIGLTKKIELEESLKNDKIISYEIKVNSDCSAEISQTEQFSGVYFENFHRKFAEITPEKRKRYFQERTASISQSARSLEKPETNYEKYPGLEKLRVKVERFAVKDGKFMYLTLPGFFLPNVIPLRSDKRTLPYYFNEDSRLTLEYKIHLPKDYSKVKLAPSSFTWACGRADDLSRLNFETVIISSEPRVLTVKCKINFVPAIFGVDAYGSLLDLNKKLSRPELRIVLTEK